MYLSKMEYLAFWGLIPLVDIRPVTEVAVWSPPPDTIEFCRKFSSDAASVSLSSPSTFTSCLMLFLLFGRA